MAYIYKIVNDINNKVYIGQTKGSLESRFKGHCYAVFDNNKQFPLYLAMRKYGAEHFSIKLVEECLEEELNEKEKYWIEYYNSYFNGYNASLGGDCSNIVKTVPIKMFSNEGVFLQDFNSIKECALFLLQKENKVVNEKDIKTYSQSISIVSLGKRKRFHNYFFIRENGPDKDFYLTVTKKVTPKIKDVKKNKRHYNKRTISYCAICGKQITFGHTYCIQCNGLKHRKVKHPSREELKEMIRNTTFVNIAKLYGVSDKAVVKWCKKENLPFRRKDIKSYSDEEWSLI